MPIPEAICIRYVAVSEIRRARHALERFGHLWLLQTCAKIKMTDYEPVR